MNHVNMKMQGHLLESFLTLFRFEIVFYLGFVVRNKSGSGDW